MPIWRSTLLTSPDSSPTERGSLLLSFRDIKNVSAPVSKSSKPYRISFTDSDDSIPMPIPIVKPENEWSVVPFESDIPFLGEDDDDDLNQEIDLINFDLASHNYYTAPISGSAIKSGILFKQDNRFFRNSWKARHVVLYSNKMVFYTEKDGRERGEINLSSCGNTSIDVMPTDAVFDGEHGTMWRFAIRTKTDRVVLSAYSEAELNDWLHHLQVAIALGSVSAGRYTDVVLPESNSSRRKYRSSDFSQ